MEDIHSSDPESIISTGRNIYYIQSGKKREVKDFQTYLNLKTQLTKGRGTVEDIEQRAQEREGQREFDVSRDISQEAATFLTSLLEAMAAYGNEEAEAMLSREFLNLSSGAKKEIQNYLMSM